MSDTLAFASVTLRALLATLTRAVISPFKGERGAQTYFKDVVFAGMRTQLGGLSAKQFHSMSPSTTTVYQQLCKQKGITPDTVDLGQGAKGHWLTKRKAERLMIYLHGGGYVATASLGCLQYFYDIATDLNSSGIDTALVALEYSCAPATVYPTQLKQAISLVRHLIEVDGWDPSKITIGGDSAGGNLTLAVLSHIAHPHPDVEPLKLSKPFHAAFLISPWVSFQYDAPSMQSNAESDAFTGATLKKWSDAFLSDPSNSSEYSEPATAPASWWSELSQVVSEVLIWGGGGEILIDGIKGWATKFEEGYGGAGGKVTTVITPKAAHDDPIIDVVLGYKTKGEGAQAVESWIKAKL